jgi:hypothetical protein
MDIERLTMIEKLLIIRYMIEKGQIRYAGAGFTGPYIPDGAEIIDGKVVLD